LFELRLIIEPAAAALAAHRRTPDDLARMRDALQRMERHGLATADGQSADREFHDAILGATRNPALVALSSGIGAAVRWTTIFKQRKRRLPRDPMPDHWRVLDAIAAGGAEAARVAIWTSSRCIENAAVDEVASHVSTGVNRRSAAFIVRVMITGNFFVGAREASGRDTYRALDAANGAALEPPFQTATLADVDRACELASHAFEAFRNTDVEERARFLEAIADNIAGSGDELIVRAMTETGLPRPRLEGERANVGNCDCSPVSTRGLARVANRHCATRTHAAATGPAPAQDPHRSRRDLRRQQLSAGVLRCRRRYRVGAGRRLPGRGPGTSGAPWRGRARGACHYEGRDRSCVAARRVFVRDRSRARNRQGVG
jgi:hypothetical protein